MKQIQASYQQSFMLWKLVKALNGQMNKGSQQLEASKF